MFSQSCLRQISVVLEHLGGVDLRFSRKEEELHFKYCLEARLIRNGLATHVVFIIVMGIGILSGEKYEFDFEMGNARSYWTMSAFFLSVQLEIVALLAYFRLRYQCCKRWNWEIIFTISFTLLVASMPWTTGWVTAELYDVDPAQVWERDMRSSEGITVLIIDAVTTILCLLVPIRMNFKWIPPAIGLLSFILSIIVAGSPFPSQLKNNIVGLCVLIVFALFGAWHNEQVARQNFVAQRLVERASIELNSSSRRAQDLVDEKNAFEILLSMVSDATLWLAADENTILKCDERFNTIIGDGASMQGKPLSTCFTPGEESRLRDGLKRADDAPTLVPTSLVSSANPDLRVNIDCFIVRHRTVFGEASMQAGSETSRPAFLLGMRIMGEVTKGSASPGQAFDKVQVVNMLHDALDDRYQLERFDDVSTIRNSIAETFETTSTGRVFKDLVARVQANRNGCSQDIEQLPFEELLALGKRQGWLLDVDHVTINQGDILGSGSFGVVVGGSLHGTPVAVKRPTMHKKSLHPEHSIGSFANELCVIRHVRHPNIVLFFGALVDSRSKAISLILERVDGKDLGQYVADLALGSQAQIRWQLIMDIASALRYLHAQQPQIIHGDLKDGNVLVECHKPAAKLTDFGLSRVLTRNVQPMGGTLRWIAPEIILGQSVKPRACADVFSFGCIVYMILSGKKPLEGVDRETILQIAKSYQIGYWIWSDDMPWKDLCSELCCKTSYLEPERRPSMQELHCEIATWSGLGHFVDRRLPLVAPDDKSELACCSNKVNACLLPYSPSLIFRSTRLVLPNRQATHVQAKILALSLQGKHWNFPIDYRSCCPWHAMMADMHTTLQAMWELPCKRSFMPYSRSQCGICGTLHIKRRCPLCDNHAAQNSQASSQSSSGGSTNSYSETRSENALVVL